MECKGIVLADYAMALSGTAPRSSPARPAVRSSVTVTVSALRSRSQPVNPRGGHVYEHTEAGREHVDT